MNKKILKGMTAMLSLMMAFPGFTACGGGGGDVSFDESGNIIPTNRVTKISFWSMTDEYEEKALESLADSFNEKYEGVIEVGVTYKDPSSYQANFVTLMLSGPDVAMVDEQFFKGYAEKNSLMDITERYNNALAKYETSNGAEGLDGNDMYTNVMDRYRYDVETTTSNSDDPLWALAKDFTPTGIFFNKDFFTAANIQIVSESEESIEAYNKANPTNKKIIKAFYEKDGQYYFNKSIAMSWQECVELSQKLMVKANEDVTDAKKMKYGFFSEWWFNYGFSVGGDCIEYVPTNDAAYNGGYWEFTLADESKNYIVKDDADPITVNGNTYNAGEIVEWGDKSALTSAQKASCNELPSQREAFTEFVRLSMPTTTQVDDVNGVYASNSDFYGADANGKIYGYGITPEADDMGERRDSYFSSGKVAMIVSTAAAQRQYTEMLGEDKFDIAPMLVYKEYNADGTEVLVHGVEGAHSGSKGIVMNKNTKKAEAAWLFMEYVASKEGQEVLASSGMSVPYYKSLARDPEGAFLSSDYAADNSIVLVDAAEYQTAGDWWYLKDREWIVGWSGILNTDVRGGKMTLSDFYKHDDYTSTQDLLYNYTKKQ